MNRKRYSLLQGKERVNDMRRTALVLLIIVILSPVAIFAEPKWVQFAVLESNGKKPAPIYFDVNSIKTSDLGEEMKLVTVRMKCSEFAVAQGYHASNPYAIDQSSWQKAVESASVESVILRYPTMTYAAPRYPSMTYSTPQIIQRGPTGFQNIQQGSVIELLYLALMDKGYVVMKNNSKQKQIALGKK